VNEMAASSYTGGQPGTAAPALDLTPDDEWYIKELLPFPRQGEDGCITIACTQGQGRWVEEAVTTSDAALATIRKAAADPSVIGVFASQGRMQARKRSAQNASAFRSMWLDLDAKDFQKPGEDIRAVYERILHDLDAFCAAAELPAPSVLVWSGGGVHAFWLFDESIFKKQWEPLAHALRAAANQHGLPADLGVTTDAARVLRVAGTYNRKPEYGQAREAIIILPKNKAPPTRYKPTALEATLKKYVSALPTSARTSNVVQLPGFEKRPPITGPSELSAGIEPDITEIRSAVLAIPQGQFAREDGWMTVARALAHTAWLHPTLSEELWAILDEASRGAPRYHQDDNRQRWERYIREAPQSERPITLSTVFHLARVAGWTGGSAQITCKGNATLPGGNGTLPGNRMPLQGGVYDRATALALFNSHFFIAMVAGAAPIAQIQEDGTIRYLAPKDFSLLVRNIIVRGASKPISGEKFWLAHPDRHQRKIVFRPGSDVAPDEYNLWQGFGVTPVKGWNKQCRLLRHIFRVICRSDKTKFKYLMRWLAWAVQHPGERPETVIVLISRAQGTGKTTLSTVMRDIFGKHGRVISSKQRLLSQFNADLETTCWVSGEEMLWSGDKGGADALKSVITGDTLTLEVKNGARWDVPNRLHIMMTTNHEHAVTAGVHERRHFVVEVSDEKAQQSDWFDPLHRDLADGGKEQFLWLLQNLRLGSWHPRRLPKTVEAAEQQRMSADTVCQWASACIEADGIIELPRNWVMHSLPSTVETNALLTSYSSFCRQHGKHCVDERSFGKKLSAMFGKDARTRLPAQSCGRRPWGYPVPDADTWRKALDKCLGI
jgi:Family of unknown function (DUF5906)/Primase C terminal 2 (PriCT-2)